MTAIAVETTTASANPIDLIEEIVAANQWAHDRSADEEIAVEVSGRWCDYRMFFLWQQDTSALHFTCGFDMKVAKGSRAAVFELLAAINEKLLIGHFDLGVEDPAPCFRQGVLLRGAMGASVEQLEDLVDIALTECERFYPAFQLVVWGGKGAQDAIAAAMIDPMGEA